MKGGVDNTKRDIPSQAAKRAAQGTDAARVAKGSGVCVKKKEALVNGVRKRGTTASTAAGRRLPARACPECNKGRLNVLYVGSARAPYVECASRCGYLAELARDPISGYRLVPCPDRIEALWKKSARWRKRGWGLPPPFSWGQPTQEIKFGQIVWNGFVATTETDTPELGSTCSGRPVAFGDGQVSPRTAPT